MKYYFLSVASLDEDNRLVLTSYAIKDQHPFQKTRALFHETGNGHALISYQEITENEYVMFDTLNN